LTKLLWLENGNVPIPAVPYILASALRSPGQGLRDVR